MSGLRNIGRHIKAISSIHKITTTMKSISASKFLRAERALIKARLFGYSVMHFYKLNNLKFDPNTEGSLVVAVTSDRGLCGSKHTRVSKQAKSYFLDKRAERPQLVCIGERGKAVLQMELAHRISLVVNGIGHRNPTFSDASDIAHVVTNPSDFITGSLVYAKFRNLMSYEISEIEIYSPAVFASVIEYYKYNSEPEDLLSYFEFLSVVTTFYCLSESHATELAARILAMTSASRSAKDIVRGLNLEYNKRRQDSITREIIEIVSGTAALQKKRK